MTRLERSPLHGSVVALALTAVALLISLLLRPYLEPDIFIVSMGSFILLLNAVA